MQIRAAIEQLPSEYRQVIVLRNVEGLSYADVAQQMGRSVDGVQKLWIRSLAQRQVDELNKQKESVGAHLAQISQLLGAQMPGLADVLKTSPPQQQAVSAPAAKAVTAGPPAPAAPEPAATAARHSAPANGGAKQPSGKEGEDEWWTE